MEGKKFWLHKITLFLFVVGLTLRLYQPSLAYDQHITHPALTAEIARFFNLKNNNQQFAIGQQETNWMREGAEEEDEPARWINHFFDPVHNVGWSGKHFGYLTQEDGYHTGADLAPKPSLPSIEWATNQEYQAAYGRQYGNQTWQRALKAYVDGDRKTAFIALGHVLHLIEDASVPDHTRDDSHPGVEGDPGSPYEESSKDFVQNHALVVAENLITTKQSMPEWDSLQSAFYSIANYSNNNFYSEDTIFESSFSSPNIKKLVLVDQDGNKYLYDTSNKAFLLKVKIDIGFEQLGSLLTTDDFKTVMPSYRNHLFPKVVQTGAGVVQLFFKQGEYYKQHPNELEPIVLDSNAPFIDDLKQAPTRALLKVCGWVGESYCQNAESKLESVKVSLGLAFPVAAVSLPLSSLPQLSNAPVSPPAPAKTAAPKAVLGEKIVAPDVIVTKNDTPAPEPVQQPPVPKPVVVTTTVKTYAPILGGGGASINDGIVVSSSAQIDQVVISSSTDKVSSSTTPIIDVDPPSSPTLAVSVVSTTITINLASQDNVSSHLLFDVFFSTSSASTSVWIPVASSSSLASVSINGARGVTYYFRARAYDEVGNVSNWSDKTNGVFVNWSGEVVINEVAWAGTSANRKNDEWFELYNTTDAPIDIKNWVIKANGQSVPIVKNISTTIAAHGYLLFENNSDHVIEDMPADAIYSYFMNDAGVKLELLKPNGEKADEVDCSKGWFAGDNNDKYRSMERVDVFASGSDAKNWQSSVGMRMLGLGFGGGPLYGSPRQPNTGFITLNFVQEEPVRILTKANNPYVLKYYQIPVGYTLNIEPGVVIKSYYADSKIEVRGKIETAGTVESPVVFTSGKDRSFGDPLLDATVGSWAINTPQAKDWQGFWFYPGSLGVFNGAAIRYAGKDFRINNYIYTGFVSQAIRAESATLSFTNSNITNSASNFLHLENSTTTINHSTLAYGDVAIDAYDSDLSVDDSTFDNFTNSNGPLMLRVKWPQLDALTLTNNAFNAPFLNVVTITKDAALSKGTPVAFDGLTIAPSTTLYIEPGARLFPATFGVLDVKGALVASGTENEPIVIRPFDQNNLWSSVRFSHSTSSLDYVYMSGGNRLFRYSPGDDGMLVCNDSAVTIDHSIISDIRDGGSNLIQTTNSELVIKNSLLSQSVKTKFGVTGIKDNSGSVTLDNVQLNNLQYGLYSGGNPPPFTLLNMGLGNFTNVDTLWTPPGWFSWPVVATST